MAKKDPLMKLAKKGQSTLPKPQQVSTHFTASVDAKPLLKPKPMKPIKIKPKVRAQRVKAPRARPEHQGQHIQQAQAPAYRNEDFQFAYNVDNIGITINVLFKGAPMFSFILPANDFDLWVVTGWQDKYQYVKSRVPTHVFFNDKHLTHRVIQTIIRLLDTIFAEAAEIAAREAQIQQAQLQAQQAQIKRRV